MKILCASFGKWRMEHSECKDGRQFLDTEVVPHLQAGMCLVSCSVVAEGGRSLNCMYIKASETDVAPADLLFNRCLCRCCWECLELDGKLLPAA